MKKASILLILFIFSSHAYAATAYKWVDREGVVNYTDDLGNVPPEYREKVEVEESVSERSTPLPTSSLPPEISPQTKEGGKDRYGMSADYWRDRARPLHQKLKEATANAESVESQIREKVAALSGRFLSPTQHNILTSQLQGLREQKMLYEAQANEAKEKLDKLAKEAEEAQADPEWIK